MKTWEAPHIPEVGDRWPERDIQLVIANAGARLAEKDFADIYPADSIQADTAFTERKRREHETGRLSESDERAEQIGLALEAAIEQAVNSLEWFSAGQVAAHYVRTARYDDYHGVDGVLEFAIKTKTGEVRRIVLAVDASLSKKTEALERKVSLSTKRVLGRPDAEITGPITVKYFESKAERHFRGPLKNAVPVVIGIDAKDCFELIEHLARTIRLESSNLDNETIAQKLKEETTALRAHPAQIIFLKEIEYQLQRYLQLLDTPMAVAPTVKKDDLKIILGIIGYITKIKHSEGVQLGALADDKVFAAIKKITGNRAEIAAAA